VPNRSFSFVTFAGVMILAIACSSDTPIDPEAPSQLDNPGPTRPASVSVS
jgi:hypothetical protein